MGEKYRVQKLLSRYGYCSRRKGEELIKEGKVKVNDNTISLGDQAGEEDKIFVNNQLIKKQKNIYLMFNKPVGCVTSLKDPKYKTVMAYIDIVERVFPIGRLDYNTSGMLLLTNDGDFANKVMHPRYEIKKTYVVNLQNALTEKQISEIKNGIELEDGKTSPAKIKRISYNLYEITIHEGKNRIIRRMMKTLGMAIKTLERTRIENLELKGLKMGKYKELTKEQIDSILKN
ncbi:rRNA pseudouridine synthase [Candidatus Woesearchaeota archaeon]|nr:rRNA pseudouridine synthase [Candidatus Woesearchaeota archaeon]MBL7051369.1 rRNA pseudouridine synthase [Candidatus Woesearchaeota archaeon]